MAPSPPGSRGTPRRYVDARFRVTGLAASPTVRVSVLDPTGSIAVMTVVHHEPDADPVAEAPSSPVSVQVLLYSDDSSTRDAVRLGVGSRPAKDVRIAGWHECATAPAVIEAADAGGYDLLILDGEASPVGGLGLCRQLKNEIFDCPPILVLTGRPQDGWLAAWSQADQAVSHPLDPFALCTAIARLARAATGVG